MLRIVLGRAGTARPGILPLGELAIAAPAPCWASTPFDQPDVEASKIETRKLTDAYEKTGKLPDESPIFEEDGIKLFADARNAKELSGAKTLDAYIAAHLAPAEARRLRGVLGLYPAGKGHGRGAAGNPARRARQEARRDLRRLRPALPAFDRTGLQGAGRIRASSCRSPAPIPRT
ncbi:MAG: hypothetical protein WDN69_06895 [Aliidongia sp.]